MCGCVSYNFKVTSYCICKKYLKWGKEWDWGIRMVYEILGLPKILIDDIFYEQYIDIKKWKRSIWCR